MTRFIQPRGRAAALTLLTMAAGGVQADIVLKDGNFLHQICAADQPKAMQLSCVAYIRGVVEGLWLGASLSTERAKQPYCFPDGVVLEQVHDVVMQDLRARPEDRHEAAPALIWRALKERFPCS